MTKKELEKAIREGKVQTVQHFSGAIPFHMIESGIRRANIEQIKQHAPRTKWSTIRTLKEAELTTSFKPDQFIIVIWTDTENKTVYFIN